MYLYKTKTILMCINCDANLFELKDGWEKQAAIYGLPGETYFSKIHPDADPWDATCPCCEKKWFDWKECAPVVKTNQGTLPKEA